MKRFVVLDKAVGQTPLECAEAWRATASPSYSDVPLAYAGRLDPMASGTLLVLIGDECKKQTDYHNLDKAYEFEVLFGTKSDTADVLGLVTPGSRTDLEREATSIKNVCKKLEGEIELPYPHYSSKTVQGKPLHTWSLENRLDEIEIPTKHSTIHSLQLQTLQTTSKQAVYDYVTTKIETIPPVTDPKKALGNDFRRPLVRESWKQWYTQALDTQYIARFYCIASSGTYMRTLAEVIATELDTTGLAYSIHRTTIGNYRPLPFLGGVWTRRYR